jgi:exopolyphosphatase / guanosine-5'-triphosphate,3'-diphosphate pyrophosphatase
MLPGVLDIGSNSAQLQVFEARPGAPPLPTHAVKEPTLLGEAFGPDGTIEPAGVDRVVVAVNKAMTAALREGIILHYLQPPSTSRSTSRCARSPARLTGPVRRTRQARVVSAGWRS